MPSVNIRFSGTETATAARVHREMTVMVPNMVSRRFLRALRPTITPRAMLVRA